MPLRLNGSTSGYSQLDAPAIAGDQTFTLPGTGGTLDRLNRAGNILQVVSTTKTDNFTTTSSSFTDVTGLNVSITPSSTSSKILIFADMCISQPSGNTCQWQLVRGSTAIAINTAGNTWPATGTVIYDDVGNVGLIATSATFLDSPASTSSLTYKIQVVSRAGTTMAVNRRVSDTTPSGVSSITIMEVAA